MPPGRVLLHAAVLSCLVGAGRPTAPWAGWTGRETFFRTEASSTFERVETGGRTLVNLTFLDGTRMEGFDGQDLVQLGQVRDDTCIHIYSR